MDIHEICSLSPVIPVLVVEDINHAEPLASALYDGGLRVFEVTLRTPAALQVITRMRKAVPEAIIGAGTLLSIEDIEAAQKAAAQFGVMPGVTDSLLEAAKEIALPMLPGVATPSEAMLAREKGFSVLKFFPAVANGGAKTLKAWAAPLAGIRFVPTGGITAETAKSYLELPNVICVGGSWLASPELLKTKQWGEISKLAKQSLTFL